MAVRVLLMSPEGKEVMAVRRKSWLSAFSVSPRSPIVIEGKEVMAVRVLCLDGCPRSPSAFSTRAFSHVRVLPRAFSRRHTYTRADGIHIMQMNLTGPGEVKT